MALQWFSETSGVVFLLSNKIQIFYFHGTKNLSYSKEKCKVGKQTWYTMGEKFSRYSSHRGLVSRLYKELKKLNSVLNAMYPSNLFPLGSSNFVEEEAERVKPLGMEDTKKSRLSHLVKTMTAPLEFGD